MVKNRYLHREVAGILGVNEKTIRRWIEAGYLPAKKDGRFWVITLSDLLDFINEDNDHSKYKYKKQFNDYFGFAK